MKQAIFMGVFMICSTLNAGITRDIQCEINEINVALSSDEHTELQREFLIGKAEGMFETLIILYGYGIE